MDKIEQLTDEQIAKLPAYRDKWLRIGLSTERADRDKCHSIIKEVYAVANMAEPKIKIWLDSPYQGAIAAALLTGTDVAGAQVWDQVGDQMGAQVRDQVWDQVWDQVGDQMGAQVRDQVWDQVGDQMGAQVRDQVWDQVGDQMGAQVRDQVWDQVGDQMGAQVWDQVWDQVGDQVGAQVRDQMGAQVYRCGYGLHDAAWLSYYDFFEKECGLKDCSKLRPLMDLSENCGWFWPFQNAVIFTEKPELIFRNKENRLHHFHGPALRYRDQFCLYRFNGVAVSKEQAHLPGNEFTKEMIINEKNADVRRELVRKIGTESAIDLLQAKVIDKYKDYELLVLDLGDKLARPYLKMKNPSIDAIHIEGVAPGTKTVKQALAWRNGLDKYVEPFELT